MKKFLSFATAFALSANMFAAGAFAKEAYNPQTPECFIDDVEKYGIPYFDPEHDYHDCSMGEMHGLPKEEVAASIQNIMRFLGYYDEEKDDYVEWIEREDNEDTHGTPDWLSIFMHSWDYTRIYGRYIEPKLLEGVDEKFIDDMYNDYELLYHNPDYDFTEMPDEEFFKQDYYSIQQSIENMIRYMKLTDEQVDELEDVNGKWKGLPKWENILSDYSCNGITPDPAKDYDYFKSLSDEEVQRQYNLIQQDEPEEKIDSHDYFRFQSLALGYGLDFSLGNATAYDKIKEHLHLDEESPNYGDSYNTGYLGFDTSKYGYFNGYSSVTYYGSGEINFDFDDERLDFKSVYDIERAILAVYNSQFSLDCSIYKSTEWCFYINEICGNSPHRDANRDGKNDTLDALHILKMVVGLEDRSLAKDLIADLNNDGKVSSSDALYSLEYIVGIREFRC